MPELSEVEIANMRRILAAHDSQQKPIQIIDLNNPPREVYKFQPFPKIVYNHNLSHPATENNPARVMYRTVNNQQELDAHIEAGWSTDAPAYNEPQEEYLSAKYQGEADRVQAQIDEARRRGPGRPRKEVAEVA